MAGYHSVQLQHRQADRLFGEQSVQHELSGLGALHSRAGYHQGSRQPFQFDQLGIPSIFPNTNVGADVVPGYAGQVGYRGILRGLHSWNDDLAVSKSFRVGEGKQVSLRIEAYNVTNHVVFSNPTLSISQLADTTSAGGPAAFGSSTFGEIRSSANNPRACRWP
jgi:hypothetical protein